MSGSEDRSAAKRRPYEPPVITRVKLEDRRTAAMAVCKDSMDNQMCAQDQALPLYTINPS